MEIKLFFRKSRLGAFSIEELFEAHYNSICTLASVEKKFLPRSGASLAAILYNLLYFIRNKGGVNHITGEVNYLGLIPFSNTILTVHDVNSSLVSNKFKNTILKTLWYYIPSLFVKKITVISEFTKSELIRLIPWAKKKIIVVNNPVNFKVQERATGLTSAEISGTAKVLCLGTKKNKNLERVIKATAIKNNYSLIIIGELSEIQKELLSNNKIDFENYKNLSFDEVINLYLACDMVCFVSTYEGFGMPIIEAQTLGKPVITSNLGAMQEVAGDGAVLVDPYSVNQIDQAISNLVADQSLRESIIYKGYENIKRFSQEKISSQYLEIYKGV